MYHNITYYTVIIVSESELDIRITTDIPYISPSRASYGVSIVRILEEIDGIIMAPHCISVFGYPLYSMDKVDGTHLKAT